jgi:beta-glucanase (GH16 family)
MFKMRFITAVFVFFFIFPTDFNTQTIEDHFSFDGTIDLGNENPVFDNLVWSDEFDALGTIDGSKWFHQTQLIAGDSWANGEEQHYTASDVNSYMDNGTLKIKAIKENFTDQGYEKHYTSARLNSKFAFKYGRVEIRAKLPSGAGTWPAIWLLGKNINEDGGYWDNQGFGNTIWPWCGEIDIMEPNISKTAISGTWHWNNGGGYQYDSKAVNVSNSETSQNFHDYILEWNSNTMKIYFDDVLINEMPTIAPFNEEFYILLNVAMGGSLGGDIDPEFSSDNMEIDYVRVYQESPLSVSQKVKNGVGFYPNPVDDYLNINVSELTNQNITLQIIDISGRSVYKNQHSIITSQISYNASALNPGLYFLELTQKNGRKNTFEFIKN